MENKAFSKPNTKAAIEKIITLTNMMISPTEKGSLFSNNNANVSVPSNTPPFLSVNPTPIPVLIPRKRPQVMDPEQ